MVASRGGLWLFASLLAFSRGGHGRRAKPFMRIAIVAVMISTSAILLTFAVAHGFQYEVRKRVLLFAADFQLVNLDMNTSYEQHPIAAGQRFLDSLRGLSGVRAVDGFGLKVGIIKTEDQMQGAVLRGSVDSVAFSEFVPYLLRGRMPSMREEDGEYAEEVVISSRMAARLYLDTGQSLVMYFVHKPPRVRRFEVVGIYETQMEPFDGVFVLCALRHVQELNGWGGDQVGGFEVRLDGGADSEKLGAAIEDLVAFHLQEDGGLLSVKSAYDRYTAIFDWLLLLDTNVLVLLTLMLVVASVNMITMLLILILDRTHEVGVLRALGADARQLRMIFVLRASLILLWGLGLGNVLGGVLLFAQHKWHVLSLDPREYYIDYVPVDCDAMVWLGLNGLIFSLTVLTLLVPSGAVARIRPAETLRFS